MRLFVSVAAALLLLTGFAAVFFAEPISDGLPASRLYESAVERTGAPVIVDFSWIMQGSNRPAQFELYNADEEQRQEVAPFLLPRMEPVTIPQHVDQQDHFLRSAPAASAPVAPPTIKASFPGIASTSKMQPDPMISVGPTRIMVAVNTTVSIYNKVGQKRSETTFDHWFEPLAPIAGGSTLFDPQLLFDQYTGHYIFLCDARRSDHRSWYLFSVSRTSDPEGPWAFWAIDMQLTGGSRPDLWADFPRLGIDENAIYLTANMYTFRTYIFRYGKIRVLKKSEVYSFGGLTTYEFSQMIDATGVYARNIHAAHSYGTATTEYLVNTRNDAGSKITLWAVSNAAVKPALTMIPVSVSSYQVPPEAEQKGGGVVINTATEGTGVLSAVYRGGSIYTAHAISKDWGRGPVSAIRYYRISSSGQILQETTYGSVDFSCYMPALSVNSKGDVAMVFNRSGKTQFAGIFFAGRKAADPPGVFSPGVLLAAGKANYTVVFQGTNIGRWGDYNAVAVDPANQNFWIYSEYVKTSVVWDTVIAQIGY